MRGLWLATSAFVTLVAIAAPAGADSLTCSPAAPACTLYVDSAPNVYGSPDWDPWWNQAKADVVAGSFVNMRTGTFPSTLTMDPYDEIVYSTNDLGKRLHWIYWLPGETVEALGGRFEVKWVIDWGGASWTYEGGGWAADGPEVGWSQPASWEDYAVGGDSGVIGSLGFAWWATDDDAPPPDTYGNPYDETDQADIDALRDLVFQAQTFATGYYRWRADETSAWETCSLTVTVVPEPSLLLLSVAGAAATAAVRRRRAR